jgi:hypothetical protein
MANKAAAGYYHDFMSPLETPTITLVNELHIAAEKAEPADREKILYVREQVINGDFDASREESEEWARSPEGQRTMGMLFKRE